MSQMSEVDPRFATAPTLFFVVGAQKSGTSWLYHYLKTHPEVAVPYWKELNYWARIDGYLEEDLYVQSFAKRRAGWNLRYRLKLKLGLAGKIRRQREMGYRQVLRTAKAPGAPHKAYADALFAPRTQSSRAFGEVCPQYALIGAKTIRDMAALAPNVRFLFVMRDPVDRLISGVRHDILVTQGNAAVTVGALEDGARKAVCDPTGWVMQMTSYQDTIARLEASVPAANIAYYFYEDVFHQSQLNHLCDFLGVGHHTAELDRKIHQGARPDVTVSAAVRQKIAQGLRPVYQAMQTRFGETLPDVWQKSAALCEMLEGVDD